MAAPITLAIPYYAGFDLLRDTLRSIAAQRDADVRVLVVDDSPRGLSREERAEIALLSRPFPVRVLKNAENLGMARSWSRCLDDADTDLVTIVHGDDALEPDYARQMIALATAHPEATALFSGAHIIGRNRTPALSVPDLYKLLLVPRHGAYLRLEGDRALHSLMRGNYIFCPSLCYRRSKLAAERFDPRYRMVLDMDLTTRLLLAGHTLIGVPRARLYGYRRHEDNATQHLTKELTRFREEAAFYLDVAARAEARGFTRSARTARRRRIIQLNLLFCVVRDLAAREWADGRNKLRLYRELF